MGFLLAAISAVAADRPNILFILADDLGYGHLGCYGQQHIHTPAIDRLAAEGLRFTQAYAGAPSCGPSRASLMTGLHAGHASVRQNDGGIPLAPGELTVGDVLKSAGYATGGFGKWGLGDFGTVGVPWERGFDRFFGYLHQKHAHFYYTDYLWDNGTRFPLPGNAGGKHGEYSHDVILGKAEQFIRDHRDGPFFCYVPVTLPHHEYIVPESSLAEYSGKFEEHPPDHGRKGYALPKEPKATLAAMISHLDRGVGRLVALLDELGIARNTIVIFTSDNGGDNGVLASPDFFRPNGDLRGYKQDLYEGGIRIPAIVRWTGHIAPGSVSDFVWYFADVLPTLAELAGADAAVPDGVDGISFARLLDGRGEPARKHDYLYWEARLDNGPLRKAIRMGDWKAVTVLDSEHPKIELYDLARDPRESTDVAAQQPERVAVFRKLFETARTEPPPQIEPARPPGMDYR